MSSFVTSIGVRLRSLASDRRVLMGAAVFAIAGLLFFLPHQAKALGVEQYLAGAIAWVLGLIVNFLGKIISVLVYVLMGFLQYNGFADAPPVMMGWVIVRDFVNMFFIVILIVSAVATIVNYDSKELHVKHVLPNLIAAAILINFSKMIVGIMIDASQVVTLTFVNAFQASGIGNFSQLLGLPNFTTITRSSDANSAYSTATSGDSSTPSNLVFDVLLSYMLAMAMLVISIGVILIMILFTVGRIVGLWVLLIISPAAFFATALPGKLKKLFGSIESEFWKKLTGLLVGGPIMSFFLWLSFATVRSTQQMTEQCNGQPCGIATKLGLFKADQGGLNQDGLIGSTVAQGTAGVADVFLTRIGNADGIASFIVGVALMVIGLDQAVKASQEVGGFIGEQAQAIKKSTRAMASRLATAPIRAPWNYADRRLKITDNAVGALRAIPLVDSLTNKKLRKYQTYRKDELNKEAKEDAEFHGKLEGWQQKTEGGKIKFWSKTAPVLGTNADRKAWAMINKEESSDGKYKANVKELTDKYGKEFTAKHKDTMSPDEIKNMAKSRAQEEANATRATSFKNSLDTYDKLGDTDTVLKMQEEADKNPLLWLDNNEKFEEAVRKMSDEDIEKIPPELASNGRFWTSLLKNKKAISFSDAKDASGRTIVDPATGKARQEINPINPSTFADLATKYQKHAGKIKGIQSLLGGSIAGGAPMSESALRTASVQDFKAGKGGNARVYDAATGERRVSTEEGKTRESFGKNISSASHGRAGKDALDPNSQKDVRDMMKLGIAINEMQDVSNDEKVVGVGNGDSAVTSFVASEAANQLRGVVGKGAGATRQDINSGLDYFTTMANQFSNLDGKSKALLMQQIKGVGDSSRFLADNFKKADTSTKEAIVNFVKAVRAQSDRNTTADRNDPTGASVSAAERSADDLMVELQKYFPAQALTHTVESKNAAGDTIQTVVVDRDAAVEPISKALHS